MARRGAGAAAGPAAAAAEQALADWGHAYASEGFAARSRDAAAGLGGAQREPTAAARRARAAAAAGPPPAAFQRGSDYQRTFLAIVSGGGAAATPHGGVQPPAPPAAAAAPKLRAAAARLRAAATDGPTADPASGDALEAAAGGWARSVRDEVAPGRGPGDGAALADLLAALDELNDARHAWRGRGTAGGAPPPPPPLVPVDAPTAPPAGSFWATFQGEAAPAPAAPAPAAPQRVRRRPPRARRSPRAAAALGDRRVCAVARPARRARRRRPVCRAGDSAGGRAGRGAGGGAGAAVRGREGGAEDDTAKPALQITPLPSSSIRRLKQGQQVAVRRAQRGDLKGNGAGVKVARPLDSPPLPSPPPLPSLAPLSHRATGRVLDGAVQGGARVQAAGDDGLQVAD